ncbi:hypothetical protein [Lentzea aerocolonigenes]|uniref:hypothetical protein n=1 Tax=Lentzea aerocolonigenes TaxID=68170 RepID=UPI0012E1492B|nr:hypothetical protein [Lentzea aerocolonigenes]
MVRIAKHYELRELGHEGFEKTCRALVARMFGPDPEPNWRRRTTRGYDAAFDGRAAEYPSAEAPWDGFMILEASFNHSPLSEPGRMTHLTQRITKRFEWWFQPNRLHKQPEYIVFATNNSLAAARDGGS